MQFRKADENDIDRIMDILADGRRALAALGVDQWQEGYPYRETIEGDIAAGESYVIEDEGAVVATAMVGFAGERYYDVIEQGNWLTSSSSTHPCYAVVHRVAVSAACQGKGVASSLLGFAEQQACERGCESVRIDTHPDNEPMRRVLEKCGYARCGIIYIAHAETGSPNRIAYEKLV